MELIVVEKLALALGLGLLVGFQREWTAPHVAGIRTFALLTLLGCMIGLLVGRGSPPIGWVASCGLLVVATMLIVGNFVKFEGIADSHGLTTQMAALVMYVVGLAIGLGWLGLGIVVGGATAVLLHWKEPLHHLVDRLGRKEIRAIIQLVLIGLVVLPILPDRDLGPYAVLNPFEIWLVVVLIVGISLSGYIAYRFLGAKGGTVVGGILGGFISSTATTVSYSRRTRHTPSLSHLAALVVMIASTIVFLRVVIEISVVAPGILFEILPPLLVMALVMALIATGLYFKSSGRRMQKIPLEEDPSELKAAILFGLLYAAVLVAVAAVKEHLGDQALYVVAAFSGLTDMDAITLSTAQLIEKGRLAVDPGWRMILTGALSNLVFKGVVVGVLGDRRMLVRISVCFGLAWIGGIFLLLFWP